MERPTEAAEGIVAVRRKVALWFAVVASLLGAAGVLGFVGLRAEISRLARGAEDAAVASVVEQLETADALYERLTVASRNVLEAECLRLGAPGVSGTVTVAGRVVPGLTFGGRPVALDGAIVDSVRERMGGTATLFVRAGDTFVRVATNVIRRDGSRAIGTVLDPDGPAIRALRDGRAFTGVVDILGEAYFTSYAPIRGPDGGLLGAYYTGYKIETLAGLSAAIGKVRILDHGFVALLDRHGKPLLSSGHAAELVARAGAATLERPPGTSIEVDRHRVRRQPFGRWGLHILSSTHVPDLSARTLRLVWGVLGIIGVVVILVLVASYAFAGRLARALAGARRHEEEARLASVEARAAQAAAEAARAVALHARDEAESASRTKSAFLANMSHELRTPLNAILGYGEMLVEELQESGQTALLPDLHKIQSAGRHLLKLINDVLDLSRIEAGKMTTFVETFRIGALLDEVAATARPIFAKNENTLVVEAADDLGEMRSDLQKVRQTLLNLLANATKFTERGTVTLRAARAGDRIVFEVEDTGIGMTEEQVGRLFQPFVQADASTTRKYGGTGLGLAISRRFCQLLGGDLTVQSQLGAGSTFIAAVAACLGPTDAERGDDGPTG